MSSITPRFRDSRPIRYGVGIIAVVILLAGVGAIVAFGFGHDFAVGSSAIWAFLWLILGVGFIVVGIGQTVIRRKKIR
jgi:hypothetical protein